VLEAVTGDSFGDLRYYRRRSARVGRTEIDVSRTGYTGDLGYELWVDAKRAGALWDAVMKAGQPFGIRVAGMLALDVARIEAGLILLEVDYTSARHALIPEQNYSPFEIGLGRLVDFSKPEFVGRRALELEQAAGGPARRLVGIELDWAGIEALFAKHDQPPAVSALVQREAVPVYDGNRQIGRATSIVWGPTIKKMVGFASVPPSHASVGTALFVEWSVEGERGKVGAHVVPMPFLDLPRKRS
jgi:aminomethyltransferase